MNATSAPYPIAARDGDDPLRAVSQLGWRAERAGTLVGLTFSVAAHVGAMALPIVILLMLAMGRYVVDMRKELREYFATEIAVDVEEEKKAEEEPEPEPEVVEPEPKVEPVALPEPDKEDDPYEDDEPAPTPAEAADALTTDAVDMTGEGWDLVDKDGSKTTGGGYTSAKGKSQKPVRTKRARSDGEERGKGRGPAKRTKANETRSAMPVGSTEWNCPFPPQADLEQVDRAAVLISVTVASDGTPKSVNVISDPGYGFAQMAKRCALTRRYSPGLDADGNAVTASTPQLRVTFTR